MDKSSSIVKIEAFSPKVKALYTTRLGGHSHNQWASFNLGLHVEDDPQAVLNNRLDLEAYIRHKIVFMDQTHSNVVKFVGLDDLVDAKAMLDGSIPISLGVKADGIVTDCTDIALAVLTADCLPLLLASDDSKIIAAIHCGWRGIYGDIVKNAVDIIKSKTQSSISAYIGPCIGEKSFEVGADLYQKFLAKNQDYQIAFKVKGDGKYLCSLDLLCSKQLNALGIDNIYHSKLDTMDKNNQLYSYRLAKITGRMASVIYFS